MSRKGKQATSLSTPSRVRSTRNSNRGREGGFLVDRFDSQIHHERWKTLEGRGITHECIIHFPVGESNFMQDRIEGLGWEFMYNGFPPINMTMDICHYLGITYELSPLGEDDVFKATVANKKADNLDINEVFQVVGKEGTNWADNPTNNTIPKKIDNAILNAKATAWHKVIMANIDPKTHGTTILMEHVLLIYVLMTEAVMNLPHIMRDVMLKRPIGNPRNLLPHPVFIMRITTQHEVPEYAGDQLYRVREQDMYYPYGDWKGAQPSTTTVLFRSATIGSAPEPSMRDVMRYLRRQERLLHRYGRQLQNTQTMIRRAFPDTVFTRLVHVSSAEDGSDGTAVLEDSDAGS
ncbi:hypothetical protein PIB30_037712 [Stylosanthes scabra]|uniref:Putative plant transposon protein domain-containing protein n=1 Tax=Stylosanthes scabra TaxID=79078 RepID=A0ABU6ZBD9_9FABA|nr:hypothetical protein [Stylosanthes scabra]